MLEAIELTRDFGTHRALDALTIRVSPGEVFCLLGANGAGKSTTMKLFLGFLVPTSGKALIDGLDVTKEPVASKRKVIYIPELVSLYSDLSGMENLAYFSALAGVENRDEAFFHDCLVRAGLSSAAVGRRAGTYSKGMRQKVGLALAYARQAKALLLDEPTSGLDPQASVEFHEALCQQREQGVAVLMATHDLFRAREVADRIGIMRGGRLQRIVDAHTISAVELESLYLEEMGYSRLSATNTRASVPANDIPRSRTE